MASWSQPPLLREMHSLREIGVLRLILQALLIGGGTGAVIGTFRYCYTWNTMHMTALLQSIDIFALPAILGIFGVLTALALLAGGIAHWEPLLSGSGIPQTELALLGHIPFPWLRLLVGKFIGTLISLSGGLSVGREGPCIQMGAAVGCGIGQIWHSQPDAMPRYLIAGGAAGMTAAFGAPLAGMFFAFEELRAILSVPLLLFTATTTVTAWGVVHELLGFGLVFAFPAPLTLSWTQLWIPVLLGPIMGLLGAGYNWLLMTVTRGYDRQNLPTPVKALLPFWCSGVLLFLYPQVLVGTGYSVPDLAALPLPLLGLLGLLVVKVAFSVISFGSGVPGGLLMPMLCIGAMIGSCLSSACSALEILPADQSACLISLCMGAMFAATVRSPFTGTALVTEMTGAWALAPAMLIATVGAALTATWLGSSPVYDSLKQRILHSRTQPQQTRQSPDTTDSGAAQR